MSEVSTQLAEQARNTSLKSPYTSMANFQEARQMAQALAASDMIPDQYKNKVSNCLIAMELASRSGTSVLAVMQNLYIVYGNPSWASKYIIGCINSSGKYEGDLSFHLKGEGDGRTCFAYAKEKATGDIKEGPEVSIKMAKDEKWYSRSGSKWPTMPEVMLRYRAASFFGNMYCPEILLGMRSVEEEYDIIETEQTPDGTYQTSGVDELTATLEGKAGNGGQDAGDVEQEQEQEQVQQQEQEQDTGEAAQGEQQQEDWNEQLQDVTPAEELHLVPTAVDVGAQISKCTNVEDIDLCRDLIRSLPNKADRDRLSQKADDMEAHLTGQGGDTNG